MLLAALGVGCSSQQLDLETARALDAGQPVMLLPIINASSTPLAGERVEAVLTTMLRMKGVGSLHAFSDQRDPDAPPELDDSLRLARALAEARERGMRWGVTGTVVEWGYRPGLDDAPAVSVSLRVLSVDEGTVVWSGSASRGGSGTVGALAQEVLRSLAEGMPLGRR